MCLAFPDLQPGLWGRRPQAAKRSGFTLVEMMVVVAIASLLAALLLPAMASAKLKARDSSCINNQRQIALSYLMALADEPGGALGKDSAAQWYLAHFGQASDGWICPDAPMQRTNLYASGAGYGTAVSPWFLYESAGGGGLDWLATDYPAGGPYPSFRSGSYTLNAYLVLAQPAFAGASVVPPQSQGGFFDNESGIDAPNLAPVLCDGTFEFIYPEPTDSPPSNLFSPLDASPVNGPALGSIMIPRHRGSPWSAPRNWDPSQTLPGAINTAFFDGHVEEVALERLWQLHWHKDWVAPATRPGLR